MANILTPQAFSNKFDRRTPYSMQWLFNVQRELAKNLTFEAGYLGSISRHLESYRGVSAAVPGTGNRCQPLALSELRDCSCWSKTAAAATTTRWAPS